MGAMKSWALVCEELHAARTHWEQCNHASMAATRAELEAHIRLERAQAEHQREIKSWIASHSAPEASQDAPGTPNGCDCEETCAECGKAVTEDEYADAPRGEPVLHDACRAEWEAGRAEDAADARAAARADEVLFGYGRGTM